MGIGLLYKWEDNNHGLEHKCGTCKTVLSSPRAKTTCLGKHEEVCTKYHKTLFYLGNSHKCDACRKSNELHNKRHREIAVIVQRTLKLDSSMAIASPLSTKKRKTRKSETPKVLSTVTDTIGELMVEGVEEWADSSTVCEEEMNIKRLRTSNTKENNSTKKAQKAEKKIVKNQMRVQIITSEDIERISQALHPFRIPLGGESCGDQNSNGNGQGLLNNSTIDANITFNTRTFRYASLRQNIHAKKLAKAQGIEAPNTPDNNVLGQEDSQIVETLGRLNITVVTAGASCSERKTLLSKLCDAIHNDLLIVENEDRDTMKRMAGYWRYVNKRTYNAMVRNNELWNWATGAKLEEIEEIEEFNEEKEAERDQEGFADGSGAHEVEVHSQDILVERYDTDFSFRDAEGLPLVLREPAEDKKGAAEGQFDGKPDTRHLTSINHRASYYPEPVSANPLNQTGKAGKQIVDGGEEDAFVAEDEEHQYYNEHYDYEYGEDVNYYIAHSTKYKNSAPLFRHSRSKAKNVGERFSKLATAKVTALKAPTPKSTTPKVTTPKVTIPKAKILKITIPKVKTTKAKSPRAKSSKAKGTPTANRDGPSYAAVLRHGLKEP